MSRLLAPLRSLAATARANPRETFALVCLGAFGGCAVAGAVILKGAGVGLIVAAICALTVALLFGTEDES